MICSPINGILTLERRSKAPEESECNSVTTADRQQSAFYTSLGLTSLQVQSGSATPQSIHFMNTTDL